MELASSATMPQARAIATQQLKSMMDELDRRAAPPTQADAAAHTASAAYLAGEIKRFLDRPSQPAPRLALPDAPPGAPIGQPAMDWLRRIDGECRDDR
jgi:hypothetical protein